MSTVSGKSEIMRFLSETRVPCLQDLDEIMAYKKTRTKIFNERKRMRELVRGKLNDLIQ